MADSSVSIALATHNGARHLSDQLADISAQTHLPSELVVCDDASSDDTLSIVQNFAVSAPFPVRIHHNPERLGYRANFIRCAGLCRFDIIAFCDQDDRWLPRKLETVVSCFADPDVLLVFHDANVVTEDGKSIATLFPTANGMITHTPLSISPWLFAPGFTQLFRRSLLALDHWWEGSQDHNADGEPLAHDQWYFFLASVLGQILYVPEALAEYRQHGRNTFGWSKLSPALHLRVLREIKSARSSISRRVRAAECRTVILEQAAAGLDEPWKGRALRGASRYRELAARCRLRASLYEAGNYRQRASAFLRLIRAGAYGADPWYFGRMAFAMDTTVGLSGLYPKRETHVTASAEVVDRGETACGGRAP